MQLCGSPVSSSGIFRGHITEESKEIEGEEDFDVILAAAERVQQEQY